jgi:lysozyme
LTPPEEDLSPEQAPEPPKLELAAVNDSEPGLFDLPRGDTAPAADAVQQSEGEPAVDLTEPVRRDASTIGATRGFGAAAGLAAAGVGLFGGCLFWAINMPPPQPNGGINPGTIVWLAGIAGVGLIGVAVYMILDRLGRADGEADLGRDE